MLIRITARDTNNNKHMSHDHTSEQALNLVRTALLALQPMDDTSADIMALNFMNKVESGSAQCIENTKNNNTLTFVRI